MRYIDSPELEGLNQHLSAVDLGNRVVNARLEAYTCRPYKEDKRLLTEINGQFESSNGAICNSPLGSMRLPSTRKLLSQLISTLNQSFVDYDFSAAKPDDFQRVSSDDAALAINMHCLGPLEKLHPDLKERFWHTLDDFIDLNASDIFQYVPNLDSDVFTLGKLFSINFFIINRKKRRLVFFACAAVSGMHAINSMHRPMETMMDLQDVSEPDDDECVSSEEDLGCRSIASSWLGNVTVVDGESSAAV